MQTLCRESKSNSPIPAGAENQPVAGSTVALAPASKPAATAGRFALEPWSHLAPRGEFAHGESGTLQVIDDRALAAMVNQFRAEATRPNFPGLLVDFDHFSYDPDKPSTAAGWVVAMERRDDGLWGRVRWTEAGEEAVTNGEYRFISPTWLRRDMEPVAPESPASGPAPASPARQRPVRLDSLALTNSPNLRGMVPLSNSRRSAAPQTAPADAGPKTTTNRKMKSVCSLLGLHEDAAEQAVHAEVTKLLNRAASAEAALAPLNNRATQLEADNKALLDAQVEADLVIHANKFPAAAREKWKTALLANRASALGLLADLPSAVSQSAVSAESVDKLGRPLSGRIHNRATAGDPGRRLALDAPDTDSPQARAAAAAIRNRATELRAANRKLTYDQAFQAAKNELAQC
jgi:phage I-like protein